MKSTVIHRINAVLLAITGLFSLFTVVSVCKLAGSKDIDLPPDEKSIIPFVTAFCLIYGLVCLFYAYCRFFWNRENNPVLLFCRKWLVYVLALAAHGLSLIWIIPVLFGMTDLRKMVALPLGLVAAINVITDVAPYLRVLGIWVKEALFTKIKKKSA